MEKLIHGASCCQKYTLYRKRLQIKVPEHSISYEKVDGRICLSPDRGELGGSSFSPKTLQQLIFIWCMTHIPHNSDNGQFQINNNQQHSRFELIKNYFGYVLIFVHCNFRVLISMWSTWFIWSKVLAICTLPPSKFEQQSITKFFTKEGASVPQIYMKMCVVCDSNNVL